MDACSTNEHTLTKDSPSSKLLFAKDTVIYRDWVDRYSDDSAVVYTRNHSYYSYYAEIHKLPSVSDQDMAAYLAEESRAHSEQFYMYSALYELYKFVDQYKAPLSQCLEEDEFAARARLPAKLAQMLATMQTSEDNATTYSNRSYPAHT